MGERESDMTKTRLACAYGFMALCIVGLFVQATELDMRKAGAETLIIIGAAICGLSLFAKGVK